MFMRACNACVRVIGSNAYAMHRESQYQRRVAKTAIQDNSTITQRQRQRQRQRQQHRQSQRKHRLKIRLKTLTMMIASWRYEERVENEFEYTEGTKNR